ncbi:unannotated protein [freshwater metagenome]|uniref:Unannotated protein n=1 Tax=freshwater metagenome TaxID=449393 RepID=A0A6J7JY34_9ZZZZ|nr:SDR family NAD(P)-dependent oxidoreductase [Actinomycetota bacterium]MSW37014.1 SDR family NAD(P)-dependent oxidoreductase [Actinomycetota bacterium]
MITVLVGAGPGMGMALARRFGRGQGPDSAHSAHSADSGGPVALLARKPEALASYVAELAELGVDARAYPADVSDEMSLRAAFAEIRADLGDPDVVLYNASISPPGTPGEVPISDVMSAMAVGAVGALVSLQEVLPAMRARDSGTVLITGGGLALEPWPPATALGMSKAAVRNLVQAAARDLADTGVHVATVTINGVLGAPGFAPDDIAEHFWTLHVQSRDDRQSEIIFQG